MIGKLSGVIDSFADGHLILDVQGVGYLVHASARTLGRIGQKGDPASLLIDTLVREDAITLYGFADKAEQTWFRLLTSVQGVGAKAGLSILAACAPERLALIIAAQDKAALTQADGVGPKLAARILTELKDKAANMELSGGLSAPSSMGAQSYNALAQEGKGEEASGVERDAVSALTNLGYARAEAYRAVMAARAKANDNDNLQTLIREALKELSA
ncbi:MAG: Holliday junction branch migration protein RuvA [Alphaproteobacteria bacterium]